MELTKEIKDEIKIIASQTEDEIGGFLVDSNEGIKTVLCPNNAPNKKHNVLISGRDYLKAQKQGKIIAFFHSEPEKEYLSPVDIQNKNAHNIIFILFCKKTNTFNIFYPELNNNNSNYSKYLNRFFKIGKSDCFTLIREFYKDELDIEIKDVGRKTWWYDESPKLIIEKARQENFELIFNIKKIKKYDILVFSYDSKVYPRHLGIFLGGDSFLHQPRNKKSCVERLSDFSSYLYCLARKIK